LLYGRHLRGKRGVFYGTAPHFETGPTPTPGCFAHEFETKGATPKA
jgi:hypothetical protein